MQTFRAKDDLIDFAIEREQDSADWYEELSTRMAPPMRDIFTAFANEEKGHKAKLQKIKDGTGTFPPEQKIRDLKLGDYLVAATPSADMTYQDALILAMKKEKAAFRLYTDLAALCDDADMRNLMLALAQEEAKHKLRFEIEYDDQVLGEN
ncbi:MAG: ferritin family protein [Kiritimatiellae bacterium]|nr:ferritin family protein [Kiritimatiellia bacterium]